MNHQYQAERNAAVANMGAKAGPNALDSIDEMIAMLDTANQKLNVCWHRMEQLQDRVLGGSPTPPSPSNLEAKVAVVPVSLRDHLHVLMRTVELLEQSIERGMHR